MKKKKFQHNIGSKAQIRQANKKDTYIICLLHLLRIHQFKRIIPYTLNLYLYPLCSSVNYIVKHYSNAG